MLSDWYILILLRVPESGLVQSPPVSLNDMFAVSGGEIQLLEIFRVSGGDGVEVGHHDDSQWCSVSGVGIKHEPHVRPCSL